MAPPTIAGIVAAKKLLRKKMARVAARKYTWVWDKIIKEAQGVVPKKTLMPKGFTGTQDEKFQLALLYKNRIVNYALRNPKKYSGYLYRGVKYDEEDKFRHRDIVVSTTLKSFTKSLDVAKERFANIYAPTVLRLKVDKKLLPSIDFTNGNFQSEFAPGGKKYNPHVGGEEEVLLPPGKFKVIKRDYDPGNNAFFIDVKYHADKSLKNSLGYLHRAPQVHVPTPPPQQQQKKKISPPPSSIAVNHKGRKVYTGVKGGTYVLSSKGKKIYKKVLTVSSSQNNNSSPFGKNSKGRTIYKGPKGGFYVMNKGKKLYKFIH